MEKSVRINLSVPPEVDVVIERMAQVSGRSKAAVIMQSIGGDLPQWLRYLHHLDIQAAKDAAQLARADAGGVKPGVHVALARAIEKPALSRQQKRALEREQAKAKTRKINDENFL